jgi:hypothetical protein
MMRQRTGVLARVLALLLAAHLALGDQPANSARMRQKVVDLGIGTRVNVMLLDGGTVRGMLKSVDDEGFTIVTVKKWAEQRFRFEEVRAVKRPSKIPLGLWIGIAAGVGLLIFAIWYHEVDKRT